MSNKSARLVAQLFVAICYSAAAWWFLVLVFGSVQISTCAALPRTREIPAPKYIKRVYSKEVSFENVSSTSTSTSDEWRLSSLFRKFVSDTRYYNESTSLTLDNNTISNITTKYERESRELSSTKVQADKKTLGPSYETYNTANEQYKVDYKTAHVDAIRVQDVKKGVTYEAGGISVFLANEEATIMLLGHNFTNNTVIRFVTGQGRKNSPCNVHKDENEIPPFKLSTISAQGTSAMVTPAFPAKHVGKSFYICTRESTSELDDPWIHQGIDPWVTIKTSKRLLPFWLQVVLIVALLFISGLFAGLTLGLLALDRTDLKILMSTGSDTERKYASLILPLREKGNYLLCSLVLGNVLVNSTLTILLDDLTSGLFAVILSTVGIVIVGEILPQAICSRYGLEIGAKTIWITKCVMLLTFPVSYIISKLLDKILGEEIGFVYNRENLKELITVTSDHNNLEADEVNIISGALTMRKKTVEDIMTPLDQIYMLPFESILDYTTLREIRTEGYSRIPIYERSRTNIVSVLYTKDLIFVDPDDCTPLQTLAAGHANECFFILGDTTLDVVFKEFNETKRGHMAFVQKIDSADEDKDPLFVTTGLITLEDVIEELIQYNRQITT